MVRDCLSIACLWNQGIEKNETLIFKIFSIFLVDDKLTNIFKT